MSADSTSVAVSGIAIGQTITAYQFFLPPLKDVRRAVPGPNGNTGVMRDVYAGQVAAGALSIGVGAMLANMTGSRFPLYTSLFIAGIIAVTYHLAMVKNPG